MDWKEHTHQVGCIITNLQALETVLRRFLLEVHGQQMEFPKPGDKDAKATYLTNWLSLDALVRQFNESLEKSEKDFTVDKSIILVRDAFAHGRLLTHDEFPARLWKFGLERDGRVPVEFCEELTVDWLKDTSNRIERDKKKVVNCFKARGYKGLQ